MMKKLSPRAVAKAFAEVLADAPAGQRPRAVAACARYVARARLLHRRAEILDALTEALLEREGKRRAEVESADRLEPAAVARVEGALRSLAGAPVVARLRVRPGLLAGFRASVGGLSIDASLKGALGRLRRNFSCRP